MKIQLARIIDSNYFFLSLVLFAVVLPFSQALVSIFSGIIFFTALVEDSWKNKLERVGQNRIIVIFPAIFSIYLLSAFFSGSLRLSLYDLQKTLFFLIIPLSFLLGKQLSGIQIRFLFFSFSLAIVISTFVAFCRLYFSNDIVNFAVHKATMISHIRFSFQLILVFWFYVIMILKNYKILKKQTIMLLLLMALYFLFFLLFQQSLTGIIALITSCLIFCLVLIFKTRNWVRIVSLTGIVLVVVIPVLFVINVVSRFYNIEKIDSDSIEKVTKQGNFYSHDFKNLMVENGHYVYLYVCETELREEWNKISVLKYDSPGKNGYPVYSTLLRYMTSKGLRKDAEGIHALSKEDVLNIENGVANVIFANQKFSLYPRIYQTVWEYYVYSKTGDANQQSFSQRIEYTKAALSIIRQNFWLGVGTANWKEEFKNAYNRNNPHFNKENYASSHNQYLNYMVKFGFIGLVIIMYLFVYPVFRTKKYQDTLFLIFLTFMFFANFADSNLETHMGSSFFVFFYCLLILEKGTGYFDLPDKKLTTERGEDKENEIDELSVHSII